MLNLNPKLVINFYSNQEGKLKKMESWVARIDEKDEDDHHQKDLFKKK